MAGWKIRREIEPIALTALVLSLLAVSTQFLAWIRGPEIKLLTPATVALYANKSPEGTLMIRAAAPLSYANLAQQPFGTLVTSERLNIGIGKLHSKQQWNAFGKIETVGPNFKITSTELAIPQAAPAQDSVNHFTLFTPVRNYCPDGKCNPTEDYITPEQLQLAAAGTDRIHFEFAIETIEGETISASCDVILNEVSRGKLANIVNSAFYALCREPEKM